MRRLAFGAAALASMAGCSAYDSRPPADSTPLPLTATAELRDAYGRSMGTAIVTQMGDGVRVAVQGMNMPAGAHGIHIHQTGVCAPPDFASAGPHWNPRGSQHGKDNPAGMHAGDLPNLLIGTDGQGTLEYAVPGTILAGPSPALLDGDGAALVVHASADDYRTDPSGNSGGRIACGVFR